MDNSKESRLRDMENSLLLDIAKTPANPLSYQAAILFHLRNARALAPILLALVSLPIGVFIRKGSKISGLGASIPVLLLYFLLSIITEALMENTANPPFSLAYAPLIILVFLSIPFYYTLCKK
jgi:lipopolysaccharide export LptBFGC system permease protein LptF